MVKITCSLICVDLLVSVAETSELFLASSVPDVEADGSMVGVEHHRVYLNTESGDVLLLELSGEMSLDEGGLAYTTVTHKHELVFSNNLSLSFHFYKRRLLSH